MEKWIIKFLLRFAEIFSGKYLRKYFKEYVLISIENLCEEIYNLEDLTDRSDIFRSPLMIFLLVSSFYRKLQERKVYPEFFSGFF